MGARSRRNLGGHAAHWAGLGSPGLGEQGGVSHGPVGGRKREAGSWPQGRRNAAARALAQGTHGGPGVPPSCWVRPPAAIPCALREAAWPERLRGAQSPHPRTHSPEHAQCGPGNFLPSRQRPRPAPGPQLAKLGAEGFGGGGCGARLWPFRSPGPCLAFAGLSALLSLTTRAAGNGVRMSSPLPEAKVRGRVARGLAVRPLAAWTGWRCGRHARGPRAVSRLGGSGCEPGDVRSHSRCHTRSCGS